MGGMLVVGTYVHTSSGNKKADFGSPVPKVKQL
jgi:hypothetical protein